MLLSRDLSLSLPVFRAGCVFPLIELEQQIRPPETLMASPVQIKSLPRPLFMRHINRDSDVFAFFCADSVFTSLDSPRDRSIGYVITLWWRTKKEAVINGHNYIEASYHRRSQTPIFSLPVSALSHPISIRFACVFGRFVVRNFCAESIRKLVDKKV